MFSAPRAGSGAGDVGPESSAISHLSETMRALFAASAGRAAGAAGAASRSPSEQGGGQPGRGRGEAGPPPFLSSLLPPIL